MSVFFTSDQHFGHSNIINLAKRPFNDIDHHNKSLINNWNSVVRPGDIVFTLGDFIFLQRDNYANQCKIVDEIFSQLNGTIHWILGNHDPKIKNIYDPNTSSQQIMDYIYNKKYCQSISHYKEIYIDDSDIEYTPQNKGRQCIILSHYPYITWNKSRYGSWMLYGHVHNHLPDNPDLLSLDVGVDCHNYTPISYEQVKELMSKKNFTPK